MLGNGQQKTLWQPTTTLQSIIEPCKAKSSYFNTNYYLSCYMGANVNTISTANIKGHTGMCGATFTHTEVFTRV